jgi:peroxiredoxin Q/BCP
MKKRKVLKAAVAAMAVLALAGPKGGLRAQPAETGPKVGEMAPNFSLMGATRYGILRDQIALENYKGNTVVLAFFFKARTKG